MKLVFVLPFLVICKEGIGDPYFFGEVSGKGEHFVLLRTEGQTLVLPVLVQVHRNCVILKYHPVNNSDKFLKCCIFYDFAIESRERKTKFVEEKLTMLTSDIESKLAIVKSKPTYRGSPEKKEQF